MTHDRDTGRARTEARSRVRGVDAAERVDRQRRIPQCGGAQWGPVPGLGLAGEDRGERRVVAAFGGGGRQLRWGVARAADESRPDWWERVERGEVHAVRLDGRI